MTSQPNRIVLDSVLSLTIYNITMSQGKIILSVSGLVTGRWPTGKIPYAVYGSDGERVMVSSVDMDQIMLWSDHPEVTMRDLPAPRKGDSVDLTLSLSVTCTGTTTD